MPMPASGFPRPALVRIPARVQLDKVRSGIGAGPDLSFVGIHKQADRDTGFLQARHGAGKRLRRAGDIQPAFGRDLPPVFGHEADFVRFHFLRDGHNPGYVGHFKVQACADALANQSNIAILHVAAVFAQVNGDSLCASQLRLNGCPDRIGFGDRSGQFLGRTISRLPQCGNVVDVYPEFQHASRVHGPMPVRNAVSPCPPSELNTASRLFILWNLDMRNGVYS